MMPTEVSILDTDGSDLGPGFHVDIAVGGLRTIRVSEYGVSFLHPNLVVGPDLLWLLPFAKSLSERIAIGACVTSAQARLLLSSRSVGQKIKENRSDTGGNREKARLREHPTGPTGKEGMMSVKIGVCGSVVGISGSAQEGYTFSFAGVEGMPMIELFTASERGVRMRDGIVVAPHLTWLLGLACGLADALFHGPEWSIEDVRSQVEECQPGPDEVAEFEFRERTGKKDTEEPNGFAYRRDVEGIHSAEEKRPTKPTTRSDEEPN